MSLVNHKEVRKIAKERGKRISKEFLYVFELLVRERLGLAINDPNGKRKTLDRKVAERVFGGRGDAALPAAQSQ